MVFLVLTRRGFEDVRPLLRANAFGLWVNTDVLSAEEASSLRLDGVSLTTFSHDVSKNSEHIAGAVATIQEHHPQESVWIESHYR